MEENKIKSIEKLNVVRKALINSSFNDLPRIIVLLAAAKQIASGAPLRLAAMADGTIQNNIEEREMYIMFLSKDIEDSQYFYSKSDAILEEFY